jgi:class 3 adenylate cyclase
VPTGTVTFLFTDIEGSTKLWEAHPEEMRAALARHDALMREAIVNANGHVFKTVGDAFCAAFAMAPDAVSAALKVQTALNTEPWPEETPIKVRMALHTGTVETRDGDSIAYPLFRTRSTGPLH